MLLVSPPASVWVMLSVWRWKSEGNFFLALVYGMCIPHITLAIVVIQSGEIQQGTIHKATRNSLEVTRRVG